MLKSIRNESSIELLSIMIADEVLMARKFCNSIPNKKIMEMAAIMEIPAPESDASVKSLGVFLKKSIDFILAIEIMVVVRLI